MHGERSGVDHSHTIPRQRGPCPGRRYFDHRRFTMASPQSTQKSKIGGPVVSCLARLAARRPGLLCVMSLGLAVVLAVTPFAAQMEWSLDV